MQTPTGSTGEVIQPVEWNMWAAALADLASWWVDVYASTNVVQPGGGTLTPQAGTPIVVNYAAFVCTLNGPARTARFSVPSGSVTLAAADTSHGRYDLIVGTASQGVVNDSAGNATALDALTVTKVTGVASGSPAIPALPANSVQLGTVLVPANATSSSTCTITQALGPLSPKNLQDLTNHIAASLTAGTVHGTTATAPGGTGGDMLAQTDFYGNVGSALNLGTGAGLTYYGPTTPGGVAADKVAVTDANGAVGRAEAAGSVWKRGDPTTDYAPTDPGGSQINSVAITDGNGAVGKAEALVSGPSQVAMDFGSVSGVYGGSPTASGTVTYTTNFAGRIPKVVFTVIASGAGASTFSVTQTSTNFTWTLNAGTGLGNTTFNWISVG